MEHLNLIILLVGFASTGFGLYMSVKNNKKTDTKEAAEQAVTLAVIKADLSTIKSGVEEMREDMKTRNALYHKMQEHLNELEKNFEILQKNTDHRLAILENKAERTFSLIDSLKSR